MGIHDIQRRKSPHVIYKDLVSWVVRNQEFDLRNYIFFKFLINIVKLIIDYAVCKRIAANYGQLLLKWIEIVTIFSLILPIFATH